MSPLAVSGQHGTMKIAHGAPAAGAQGDAGKILIASVIIRPK